MAIQQPYISADVYWELIQQAEYVDKLLELVDGQIVEMPLPSGLHGVIVMQIGSKLHTFVEQHHLGYVTAAETGYILQRNSEGRDTIRGLDVGFISYSKLPDGIRERHIPVAPDLAVEVISPGNTAQDIHKKIRELLNAGTSLVWIVYPETRTVDVHTSQGAITYEIDDTLSGGDVLSGFELKIGDIFPQ